MTPKEKAEQLAEKFLFMYRPSMHPPYLKANEAAKQCALIAVDEVLDLNLGFSNCDENNWVIEKFYTEVKQEIEKL